MKNNLIMKILCSLPVIIITTYFIPFLGIVLVLFRFFVYRQKHYRTALILILVGLILQIPKILELAKITTKIPYITEIIKSSAYPKIISCSKLLIIIGIILIIISYISNIVAEKVGTSIGNYFKEEQRKEQEISEKNDLIMQEKRETAKNTHFVKCPNCGGDNIVVGNVGKCKFCRKNIEYKDKTSK